MEKSSEYNQNYSEMTSDGKAPPGYAQATGPPYGGYNAGHQQHFHNPSAGNTAPVTHYPVPVSVPIIPQRQPAVMMQMAPAQGTMLGPNPTMVTCPSCHQTQVSQIRYESSTKTHLFAVVLCVTTCCCCIPYMIDSCKNANHICANCGAYLGTYNN